MSDERTLTGFIAAVEKHAGRPFQRRDDLMIMLQAAQDRSLHQVFLDAVFHATFVVKTRDIMARIGPEGEGYETLAPQFSEGVERVSTLVRTLLKDGPEDAKRAFTTTYFTMDQDGLGRLLELMTDLARIKHWQVDGNPMPFAGQPTKDTQPSGTSTAGERLRNLIRVVRLALALYVVVLILDGPFTIIGWVTSLIVAALLIVALYEAAAARKEVS